MGLTIHYKGQLKSPSMLQSLIEEVTDVAVANNWTYFVFENQFPNGIFSEEFDKENLYGIMVTPTKCEPFCFSFLSNGKMCGILNFMVLQNTPDYKEEYLYQVATKTQYAGHEPHKKLILLLDYVNSNYLINFECIDEGEFWETRNEQLLVENFEKSTNFINSFISGLEMIPKNENENLENYIVRIAAITNENNNMKDKNNDDDEMPKLSIEQENEFKKMKLSLENGAIFGGSTENLPPEIEAQFLDSIFQFEESFKNNEKVTVFERIGKPNFKKASEIKDETEFIVELTFLIGKLAKHKIGLEVICEYDDEAKLIYTFVTEELFDMEIDEVEIEGMETHFTYEEFHPNVMYDLEHETLHFLEMFLDKKDTLYKEFHSKDADNHKEINNFRSLFSKFKIKKLTILTIDFDEENAKTIFEIDFWGKLKEKKEEKIRYSGKGSMTFKFEYGYWYAKFVDLPIVN